MKYHNLLLVGLLLLAGCQNSEPPLFNEGPIFIEGHIDNAKDKVVLLTTLELTGRIEHTAKIDSMGNFSFFVDVLSSHDNFISYGGNSVSIYLDPGDSLYINANGANFEKTITYSGDNEKFNQCLRMFFSEFEEALISDKFFEKKNELEPDEFKKFAFSFFKEMDSKVNSIYQVVQPQKEARVWMNTYNKYRLAEDLLEYAMHNNKNLPDNYYDFENQFLENNDYVMNCSQYYEDFIAKYYLGYIIPKIEGFEEVVSKLQEQNYDGLDAMFNFISDNITDNTIKNLILTRAMNSFINFDYKMADSIYNKYSQIVNDITCQNFIQYRIDKARAQPRLVMTIDDLTNIEFVGEIFQELKQECRNKVIYLDIWGTWCGGCINSFPYLNKLYEELQNENIEFVYLCVHSNENIWQKSIKDNNLKGLHYLLTNDQFSVISEKFNCDGLPRYIIIDKDGLIVDDDAKSPYRGALKDELLALINK